MSDIFLKLGDGHTVSIWRNDDIDRVFIIYNNNQGKRKEINYPLESFSLESLCILMDLDIKDGQIWLQRVKKIIQYTPWYEDLIFDNILQFQNAVIHPYSKYGMKLTNFFKEKTYITN